MSNIHFKQYIARLRKDIDLSNCIKNRRLSLQWIEIQKSGALKIGMYAPNGNPSHLKSTKEICQGPRARHCHLAV